MLRVEQTYLFVVMGSDHGPAAPYPTEGDTPPLFLGVRPGQFVVVQELPPIAQKGEPTWFVAEVIHCDGGARNPSHFTMFQVCCVDTGVVRWVNADQVTHVLPGLEGLAVHKQSSY